MNENSQETTQSTAETVKSDQTTQTSEQAANGSATDQTRDSQQQATTETKKDEPSLLNKDEKEEKVEGAPDKYEAFKLPDGFEADETAMGEAQTLLKELNIPQAGAQRLVDFWAKISQQAAQAPLDLWKATQEEWQSEVKADREIGGKLNQVRATIHKALDGLGDPELAQSFKEALDYTGAGNNPAFIRAFYKLAQKVTEGTHVQPGAKPAPVKAPGEGPKTAAQAMYPNLPSGA